MHYLEIAGRIAIIYISCMILLRVSGRREMSELGPMDLLTMLLLSETVSPALTGGDNSILGGLVAAVTLIALSVTTTFIVFKSRAAERMIQGAAVVLVRDGKVDGGIMRKFRMTDEDLHTTLHQHGLLRVDQVKRAYVEADGEVTIIKESDDD